MTVVKRYLKRCVAEQVLHLKVGTPVMLLYNIDRKLVNGSRGKFVRLNEGKPVVNFEEAGRILTIEKKSWTFFDVADTNKVTGCKNNTVSLESLLGYGSS